MTAWGSATLAVETIALARRYRATRKRGEIVALEGISMSVERGEVRGLLGPNGAGKTTLVKLLSTMLLPTSGSACVLGHDVVREAARVRRLIGVVLGGDRGLYPNLSARQNLEYWAALYHVPARQTRATVTALLERTGLRERADDLASTYSRGMKQRLHLARSLIGDPRVLFLDEPTIGMDPMGAREFRRLIRELSAEGRTILLTTHDMAEAEALCDRVALIDRGRLLALETPAALSRYVARYERVDFEAADGAEPLLEALSRQAGVSAVERSPVHAGHRVQLADSAALGGVLALLVAAGITSIRTSRPSLEEVYLHLIGDRGLEL